MKRNICMQVVGETDRIESNLYVSLQWVTSEVNGS